jgi:hypothetical protein
VSLPAVEDAISGVLSELGVAAKRFGDQWSDGRPMVEITPFHLFRFVSIRFLAADPRVNLELDRRLRMALATAPTADNPAARWVVSAGICAFVTDLCFVVLILAATTWAG